MSTNITRTDCRKPSGVAVAMIDTINFLCRELYKKRANLGGEGSSGSDKRFARRRASLIHFKTLNRKTMSNEEVEAGNRLIAEWLGWEFVKDPDDPTLYKDHYLVKFQGNAEWQGDEREIKRVLIDGHAFHKSWNKLMPVVEEMEKEDFGFKMCRKVVEVYRDSTKEIILKTKESCRLDSLYKAVVQFITWYNTHQHGK